MDENDRRPMRADAGLAGPEHGGALGPQGVAGGIDVLDLEADVVLAAARVAREEALQRGVLAQRLDQLDLGVRQLDEAEGDPLLGQRPDRGDVRGAEELAVDLQRPFDRWGGDADVVQPADHQQRTWAGRFRMRRRSHSTSPELEEASAIRHSPSSRRHMAQSTELARPLFLNTATTRAWSLSTSCRMSRSV